MKKILSLIAIATLALTSVVFAQSAADATVEAANSYADRTTQTITVEDQYDYLHPTAKNVQITLEYTPLTDEVRLYYTCLASSYDQGEAMNTAMAVLQDFAGEHQYKHYFYKAKDKTKYFRDADSKLRMARYSSYVYYKK
ncbi:MAG TPA: hypothetical protein DDW78_07980 [Treponema sp.]|nr:hypothetical protein [Treponema sp.]